MRTERLRGALASCLVLVLPLATCAPRPIAPELPGAVRAGAFGERMRVLELYPGVTATMVAPAQLDRARRIDLILYGLPNGNSTDETIGRTLAAGAEWRYDIQHIGAQTRALASRGLSQPVVVYLEADTKSWPAWLERIAFLDSNYSFEPRHGEKILAWLGSDPRHMLVVLAYDDREITLDGKKVVSDSGGTWRASARMMLAVGARLPLAADTLGDFLRYRASQVEFDLHPNPANRILHTEMIGEMNGYMHALLAGRTGYERGGTVLKGPRAYAQWIDAGVTRPLATTPDIPVRARDAPTGSAFIASVAGLVRGEREAAVRRELLAGNIPSFLRALRPVEVTARGADSVAHTIVYEVMPDYLAIGSDDDFVRMPMTPQTAQAFCDAYGFVLPTRKMVNDIWAAAGVHLEPRPLTEEREASATFLQHHRIIEGQLAGTPRGAFVAGVKKDVVVTGKLLERADRVAIYGWQRLNGEPIQSLYTGHVDWYVDYSHGVRPVRRWMRADGTRRRFEEIVSDSQLSPLLSDEGRMAVARYDKE